MKDFEDFFTWIGVNVSDVFCSFRPVFTFVVTFFMDVLFVMSYGFIYFFTTITIPLIIIIANEIHLGYFGFGFFLFCGLSGFVLGLGRAFCRLNLIGDGKTRFWLYNLGF